MAERLPDTMLSLGLPLTRLEQRENRLYHYYRAPNSKRELAFWTQTQGEVVFFYCGVSASARSMIEGLSAAGFFEDDENGT